MLILRQSDRGDFFNGNRNSVVDGGDTFGFKKTPGVSERSFITLGHKHERRGLCDSDKPGPIGVGGGVVCEWFIIHSCQVVV